MKIEKLDHYVLTILLQITLSASCLAQVSNDDDETDNSEGRYLLDFSYIEVSSKEGATDILTTGFTWLVHPSLRVSASTDLVRFNPDTALQSDNAETLTSSGLGDSVLSLQYDWQERLTVSPWVPDNLGTSLSILLPTGDAKKALGQDTWAGSIAFSWPILIKDAWLINPVINYNFTFNEGELADHVHVAEIGVGLVRLFPLKFWVGITPSYWYDLDLHTWNFDGHITVGKMFSNGIGVGVDYGRLSRHFKPSLSDDRSLLFNFYYQFGH